MLLMAVCCLPLLPSAVWATCDAIPGADALLRPGAVLLIGEIHGTAEAPRVIGNLVCAAREAALDVAVGLEIPVTEEAAAHRLLESGDGEEDLAAIAGDFWQRDYQDGRASQAMHDLLHALKRHRPGLHLFFIDNPAAPEGRDRFMASRVAATFRKRPDAVFIVLTGNIHNRLTIGTRFDADYEPMGFHVRELLPDTDVLSLRITHSGGAAWVCAPECGVRELEGRPGTMGVELRAPDDGAYTGQLHVGPIHASLPAKDR
jgi:hypothetical protein